MAKRGENIRKRKDGRWEGRFIKGRKSDRTAIWGYIYGHSYNEVKEKLTIKKMEAQQFALKCSQSDFFRAFSNLGKLHFFRCQIFYSSTLSLHAPTLHFACAWPISCSSLERKHSRKKSSGNYCSCRPKPQDPRQRNGQGVPDACSENLPLCGTFTYYASH